jgi:hypothetical protein
VFLLCDLYISSTFVWGSYYKAAFSLELGLKFYLEREENNTNNINTEIEKYEKNQLENSTTPPMTMQRNEQK